MGKLDIQKAGNVENMQNGRLKKALLRVFGIFMELLVTLLIPPLFVVKFISRAAT